LQTKNGKKKSRDARIDNSQPSEDKDELRSDATALSGGTKGDDGGDTGEHGLVNGEQNFRETGRAWARGIEDVDESKVCIKRNVSTRHHRLFFLFFY
jgi:hypothetical protein